MDFFLPSFLELRLGDSLASRTSQAVVTWYSMVLWEWPAAETLCVPRAFSWMSSRPALHFLLHAVLNFSGFCKNKQILPSYALLPYMAIVHLFQILKLLFYLYLYPNLHLLVSLWGHTLCSIMSAICCLHINILILELNYLSFTFLYEEPNIFSVLVFISF